VRERRGGEAEAEDGVEGEEQGRGRGQGQGQEEVKGEEVNPERVSWRVKWAARVRERDASGLAYEVSKWSGSRDGSFVFGLSRRCRVGRQ
jgi:hypothetical protein